MMILSANWLLLLPLLAIAAVLLSKHKKSTCKKPIPVIVSKAEPPKEKIKVYEEEIRLYAYVLYEKRYDLSENVVVDWYQSICELTAHYKALGYRVILYWEAEVRVMR
jgi:hypothetical protein